MHSSVSSGGRSPSPSPDQPPPTKQNSRMKSLLIAACGGAWALGASVFINESRTWEEMLPTRDGILLHTRVVLPRGDEVGKYPTIIDRSPYGYSDLEWIPDLFLPGGYATVGQDMRGTKLSEGRFSIWHRDAEDSEDLGNWIVQQPWSNGEVYSFGASADGIAAFTTVNKAPTWLRNQYFIWTTSVGYPVFYPQGAMMGELIDSWIHGTVEGNWSEACYQNIKANEFYNDWWTPVELTGKYDLVNWKSGFWAGWYDIFLLGNLAAYNGYNTQSDESVRYTSFITIDPLGHCQSAAEYFPQDLIAGRSLIGLMQAYELYNIRPVTRTNIKNVTFYVMSSNDEAGLSAGNYWTSLEVFPEPVMTTYYYHGDGTLSTAPPREGETEASAYVFDPANPVPTVGGNNLDMPCGPLDQADVDKRSDVLTFETPIFTKPLPLTGPLLATLFVSSDAIDTDFMVKISDVYPTGEVRLIQDSAVRMRWREGGEVPVYMTPNEVYEVEVSLWNTSYIVAPGHALRISVSSSNYPRFSLNYNNGVLLRNPNPGEMIVANNVFYHSSKYPSHFKLPVVSQRQLPKIHDLKATFESSVPGVKAEEVLKAHPDLLGKLAETAINNLHKKKGY